MGRALRGGSNYVERARAMKIGWFGKQKGSRFNGGGVAFSVDLDLLQHATLEQEDPAAAKSPPYKKATETVWVR